MTYKKFSIVISIFALFLLALLSGCNQQESSDGQPNPSQPSLTMNVNDDGSCSIFQEGVKVGGSDWLSYPNAEQVDFDAYFDTQNQNAFLLRSRLQSSDIIYDAETNTVVSGGFNGVQIGKKFDVNKYQKDVFDILSKAKADKVSFENLVTNPDMIRQYGLDVATGFDGEKLASHFVKTGSEREGITEQEIMSYAMSLLKSNPDYPDSELLPAASCLCFFR